MARARDRARSYVNKLAAGGGAFGTVPMPPGGHSAALTALESKMCVDISRMYGIKTYGVVWKILIIILIKQLGVSTIAKGAGEVLNFIPFFGHLAKGAISAGVIKGIGEALITYYEDKFPGQEAYKKPNWSAIVSAFSWHVDLEELRDYWDSYEYTSS